MARVPYLDPADLSAANRDLLARNVNIYRAMAHSPDATRSFLALAKHIRHHSRLDARLRELAILQVGYVYRSPYEYSHHVRIAREFGVSDEEIRAVALETAGEPSNLPALASSVLRAARELSAQPELSGRTFAELKQELDNEQLVDLLLTISFYCAVVRFLGALQIDVEDDYQQYLREFPLPG
jgi:alkylhydroperoxidase family enzyme